MKGSIIMDFGSIGKWVKDKVDSAKQGWARFNNRNFKEATMAICARIAAAHGGVDESEKRDVANVINGIDELKVFDPAELYKIFEGYCDQLNKGAIGKIVCDRAAAKIKGDAEACAAACQIALMIANSDGCFQPEEQTAFKEICAAMGVDPTPYLPK